MRSFYVIITSIFIIGCASANKTAVNIKNFAKCYIHKLPAPIWVCYQSSFQSVGKIHTKNITRLKQEEAFSVGVSDLTNRLQSKTKVFLRKIGVSDPKKIEKFLKIVKDYVVINSLQGSSWYSKQEQMLYVEVKIDKNEFKKFLFSNFKNIDKKLLEIAFDETF